MRRFITLTTAGALLLGGPLGAWAHAMLDHASPRVGSSVRTPPGEVTLWFTEKLEPSFSTVTVTDASGQRVDAGRAQISGSIMRIGLRSLRPGSYRVNWRVVSVDSHRTEGSFSFQVGE